MSREGPVGFAIEGQRFEAKPLDPGLYLVATPIGNLADITLRALQTLAAADLVACEDTRVTRVLLERYAISPRGLVAYHDHNAAAQGEKLLAQLSAGKAVALVSDAGTPLLSDPGYRLSVDAAASGHRVFPIPGASALLAALVASGLPSDAFLFAGFLPPKEIARKKRLAGLAGVQATLVFYEAPQRIAASLAAMADQLGPSRKAAVARELTKRFEEVRRGTLATLAAGFTASGPPKGEIVVVVGPPVAAAPEAADIDAVLAGLLVNSGVREAAEEAAALTGLPRRELYQRALVLKARK